MMKRTSHTLALVTTGLCLWGCAQDKSASNNQPPSSDSASIAEVPTPEVTYQTYIASGQLAETHGQYDRALEQYQGALKGKPNDLSLTKRIALCYNKLSKYDKAEIWWKKYFELSNGSADAYGSLGFHYELAGNPTMAEQTYQEGIAKHPNGKLIRVNYGLMLVRQNKVDQALNNLNTVLQPAEANYDIGSVYEQMNRKDLAQFYYRRCLEQDPKFAPAKQKLASIE